MLEMQSLGDDWGVTSLSYVPGPSVRDYYPNHSRITWTLYFYELSSFPVLDCSMSTSWRSLTKYLAMCFLLLSSVLRCCSLLPVDVSSELVKVYSACFRVIKFSGSVALALTFDIRFLVQNIRKHDVTIWTFSVWAVWHLDTLWHL